MPPITAALLSVGESPAPLLHVLRQHRPAHVWYFCSPGSRANADTIQAELDWHPAPRFIEVERFEELGPCYRALRRKIPEILAETKVSPGEVLVDYTGGTKTMSAALVLAATELFHQFSYVGGEKRDETGRVVSGEEHQLLQPNPWTALALREVERARDLWDGCQFEIAAAVLREVASRVPLRLRFEAMAKLAEGMAARHRLDFGEAVRRLREAIGRLRPMFEASLSNSPMTLAETALEICTACSKETASVAFLGELLDNALRTAAQGRFEDAAARLYRVMEMQGQLWLSEMTEGLIANGKCKPDDVVRLPEVLKALPFCVPEREGAELKLNLEQLYLALAELGHEKGMRVAADIAAVDSNGKTRSRWRTATEKRNSSILAHGVQPIGAEGFEQMKQLATEFLGFDLTWETNPVPPLDPSWLE